MNDHLRPAAADRFADQTMIVAFAVAGRCVEKVDSEIECTANSSNRLRIVARHAITAETDGRYREIAIAEAAAFHERAPSITGIISELSLNQRWFGSARRARRRISCAFGEPPQR